MTNDKTSYIFGGDLLYNLRRIRPGTWQTSQQIYLNGLYHNRPVTANLVGFCLIDGKPAIKLYGRDGHLLLDPDHRFELFQGVRYNPKNPKYFILPQDMQDHIRRLTPLAGAVLEDLPLKKDTQSEYYFVKPSRDQHVVLLFLAAFGTAFPKFGKGIKIPSPDQIAETLEGKPEGMIVRFCDFCIDGTFNAGSRIKNQALQGIYAETMTLEDMWNRVDPERSRRDLETALI